MRTLFATVVLFVCMMQHPVRAFEPGEVFRDCPDCPEMVVIPPGSFDMGARKGEINERPVHRVTIKHAFAIGKTEVTQGEWREVMHEQWRTIMGNDPSFFLSCGDTCPVEQVSWNDIQIFLQRLSAQTRKQYRLPSEAEWEYACRAGGKHEYCGSDDAESVAWFGTCAGNEGECARGTVPVATKQPNAFGLYDMSGNVWEWVADSYHENYQGAPTDGSAWQKDGRLRLLRGGSWFNDPQSVRAARRFKEVPTFRSKFDGFRVVRVLPQAD
jgi:formylglycine-generating enzyme required for sulfatase activity